jgi:hypothetical protein
MNVSQINVWQMNVWNVRKPVMTAKAPPTKAGFIRWNNGV